MGSAESLGDAEPSNTGRSSRRKTMKRFLIATATLTLISGAALAQTNTGGGSQSPAGAAPAMGGDMAQPAAAASASMDSGSTMRGGAPTTATNAPAGTPPESYPVCKSKAQDRCVSRAQATNASRGNRMKHSKTTETTETSTAPATSPGL
jgi:hypothetical protein